MKKQTRQTVFDKYGGKCSYCGCELVKGWHVDHLEPIRRSQKHIRDETGRCLRDENGNYLYEKYQSHPERDCIENYMPACASCNINKHSMGLEDFRNLISGFMKHLNEINTQYKIAKRYGLVHEDIKPVVFHFEKIQSAL